MKNKRDNFTPEWIEKQPEAHSFRSIFKWGKKERFKHPSHGFYSVIKQALGLTDDDFKSPVHLGHDIVKDAVESKVSLEDIEYFKNLVGSENISLTTFDRLKYSTGKSMEEILSLRHGMIENISDLVLHPRNRDDVEKIVTYCHKQIIPLHVYGGGSSVTLGLSSPKGGITLVMQTHMNQVIELNEMNQTITVEPGMMGPDYEDLLNHAPEKLDAGQRYTGGHFPQSFEHSSVGGWVVTLGSGQASSYYGDAYDLAISQEYVTPTGSFETLDFPATATGPKLNDMMKGSEGCFGVLVAVTMKIFPYRPETVNHFSFMFPDFESVVNAARKISQAGFGMPSVLRISDPEETDVALKMYGIEGGIIDRLIKFKGLKPGKRCLLMGQTEGEHSFSNTVYQKVKQACQAHKGVSLTGYAMKKWKKGRFSDPYMRDTLNDYGVLIDTLEASVTWHDLHDLYKGVRDYIKQYPHMILMTHASHFYAQGTNLYFIFITKMDDLDAFITFQRGIIRKIAEHGGSLSHHHGVGRMMAPFMEDHLGKAQMDALRALKHHFDPNNIMNPGGLGL